MIARALELKRQQPGRAPRAINKFLAKEFGRTIPPSTVARRLKIDTCAALQNRQFLDSGSV